MINRVYGVIMPKLKLRWIICFLVFSFLGYLGGTHRNYVYASEAILSSDDALKLATAFINMDRDTSEESFKSNIYVNSSEEIFNIDGEISGYLIQLEDIDKNPSGYVIVGASHQQMPVIEYAYDGECFLETARQYITNREGLAADDLMIYYLGGLDYYIGTADDKYIYKVSSNGIVKIKRTEVNASEQIEFNDTGKEYINELWKTWEDYVKENVNNINISNISKDNIIAADKTSQPVYDSVSSVFILNYDKVPYTTIFDRNNDEDYQSGGVCATNLMLYWYCQDTKYSELFQTSWNNVFHNLYDDMSILQYCGAEPDEFLLAVKDYFKTNASGYSSAAFYSFNADWDRVSTEIDNNCPTAIVLQEGVSNEKQYVLGVGYKNYKVGTVDSPFVLIADGFGSKAVRYVHYSTDHKLGGGIAVIRLRPY
ncbi:MAG: hypothetical protein WCD89_08960 [Anaerocolumna sp.]